MRRWLLPALTVLFIAVIWAHSAMPANISSNESMYIVDLINNIFGRTLVTEHLIRKTAHFTEYAILGILCGCSFLTFNMKGGRAVLAALYICLAVAAADETIQLFSIGRNGALFDVWLDHFGSVVGIAVLNAVHYELGKHHCQK